MRILVTNDDGIHARGLALVAQSLRAVGDVMVIAPESQQSAVGHGITLHKPLRLDPVDLGPDIEAYSTNGTPADCVILGTLGLRAPTSSSRHQRRRQPRQYSAPVPSGSARGGAARCAGDRHLRVRL